MPLHVADKFGTPILSSPWRPVGLARLGGAPEIFASMSNDSRPHKIDFSRAPRRSPPFSVSAAGEALLYPALHPPFQSRKRWWMGVTGV